ncbi:MAG: n-acetylglutamate synthase [candidate division Zixibacteria bacterium]
MSEINLNNKYFKGVENYDDGDFNQDTVFHYRQDKTIVWATFQGGGTRFGTVVGYIDEKESIRMVWQYLSVLDKFISGTTVSEVEILLDGRYRLHEKWTISKPEPLRGTSVIEEISQ